MAWRKGLLDLPVHGHSSGALTCLKTSHNDQTITDFEQKSRVNRPAFLFKVQIVFAVTFGRSASDPTQTHQADDFDHYQYCGLLN
jgi:hypothetical protein